MREGRLSLDQVGVIAGRAAEGSDEHYAELARFATVSQLRTAVKLEPRPEPEPPNPSRRPRSPRPPPTRQCTHYRITLPHLEAAKFDAALASHREALVAEWKRDHDTRRRRAGVDSGRRYRTPVRRSCVWSMPAGTPRWRPARTPSSTTVVVHLDVKDKIARLHLGPLLSDADRRYLTCDATCEVWFERAGQPIGAGRATRLISRRLRRALEYRHPTLRGARVRRHPGSARPSHRALGGRRRHRAGQPGAAVSLSSPAAPSGRHHHHRTRRGSVRHRPRRPKIELGIVGSPTDPTPTRGAALPRTYRGTRPVVVVPTLPTKTTTELGA